MGNTMTNGPLIRIAGTAASLCFIFTLTTSSQWKVEPGRVKASLVTSGESQVLTGPSVLNNRHYFVWGGSVTEGEDGRYYMFYARWPAGPEEDPFKDGWLTGSEIACAVSDFPDHDFRFVKVVLRGRRKAGKPDMWDARSVYNPHIKKFDGKYYLYYTGTRDPGKPPEGSPGAGLSERDRLQQSQQTGVLVCNTLEELVSGNFTRPETPLLTPRTRVKPDRILNPSPEGVAALPDNIIVVNPSVVFRPGDKKYLLYFKGNLYDPSWRGVHGVALSGSPAGPFIPLDRFVFDIRMEDGRIASAEDPYVWYSSVDRSFYAVVKDFSGKITGESPGLALLQSADGIGWVRGKTPLFMRKELLLTDGTVVKTDRLERPQLLTGAGGVPLVLYAACALTSVNNKRDGSSFNVQVPLTEK